MVGAVPGIIRQMERSDAELLGATAVGDGDAFAAFFRRHEQGVTRFALRRCDTPSDVGDAVADTFLVALRRAKRYRPESDNALPWLLGIAQRVMAHQSRSRRRRLRLTWRAQAIAPEYAPEEYERVADALEAHQRATALQPAIEELPRGERDVLELVAYADLSPSEAAHALGISANAARVRLARARQRLKVDAVLDEPAPDPEASYARCS
jgi:RNA polymerase sigma-70 factor (ECF subfamily)